MTRLRINVQIPEELRRDVEQGVYYCSEAIVASRVDRETGTVLELELSGEGDPAALEDAVRTWVERTVASALSYEDTTLHRWGGDAHFAASVDEVLASPEIAAMGEGLVAYGPTLTRAMRGITARCEDLAAGLHAAPLTLPAVATLEHMQRCDFLRQFPQLLSFVHHFREDYGVLERYAEDCRGAEDAEGCAPSEGDLRPLSRMLRPAVCYHVYPFYEGTRLPDDRPIVSCAHGDCFRYESRNTTGLDRLFDFRMYEIVGIGDGDRLQVLRGDLIEAVKALFEELELPGRIKSSNDPFFVSASVMKSTFQRAYELKYELEVPFPNREGQLAVTSFNLHQDFFGSRFDIRTGDGEAASTGCTAFGLDRILAALLVHHGPDPERWPGATRQALGLAR